MRKFYVEFLHCIHVNVQLYKQQIESIRNSVNFQEQMCSLFVSFLVDHVLFVFTFIHLFQFCNCIGFSSLIFFFIETKLFFLV